MDDICKITASSEDHVIAHLKKRYANGEIYTNASHILIAINPYQDCSHLYGSNMMGKIYKNAIPHSYTTAQNALFGLKLKDSQSIIINGVTGSGKTESAKHVIEFLCETTAFTSDLAERIFASNTIMESFGNAETAGNQNSSRFCKFIRLNYDTNSKLIGAQIQQYLLEFNRICDLNEKRFHVFYALLCGGPANILRYLPDLVIKMTSNQLTDSPHEFQMLDTALANFQFNTEKRSVVYKILAGILLLEDIKFELKGTDSDEKCYVSESSRQNLNNAAELLKLDVCTLEDAFVSRNIGVKDTTIKINLGTSSAVKTRDSMLKMLYYQLFKQILVHINKTITFSSSTAYIGILDIAGHESKENIPNAFDQICINYANEQFQQFFIQRILRKEKEWYDEEKIDVPFVPFFDNCGIIDIFDNKSKGLFALLDQECILMKPSVDNFTKKFLCAWSGSRTKKVNQFIIHHFAGPVNYSTVDFVEKNLMQISNNVHSVANQILKQLTEVDIEIIANKPKSFSLNMRNELNTLIKSLQETNCQFIRCIKPNHEKSPKNFDSKLVVEQLKSANLIAYAQFMQFGYPSRVSFDSLDSKYRQFFLSSVFGYGLNGINRFYTKLLLSIGFKLQDFKFGEKLIFFRAQNSDLMDRFLGSPSNPIDSSIKKMKTYIARSKIRVTVFCLLFSNGIAKTCKDRKKPSTEQPKELDMVSDSCICVYPEKKSSVQNEEKKYENLGNPLNSTKENKLKNALRYNDKGAIPKIAPNMLTKKNRDVKFKKLTRSKKENRPKNSIRYDGKHHLPRYDTNKYASRCKNKECKFQTNVTCTKCDIHLCLTRTRNCFEYFHILMMENHDENFRESICFKKENRPKNSTRYDGEHHLPRYDTNGYASRCKNEECKLKTNVTCSKCGVHLCFVRGRDCFKEFHILELI